ncbi:unnamed protein product [Clonostachys rhizophaga]|uniref:DJ-1/PfpI domain-containing protein n=1 Tax=Clonostachys rhizophaga TaxID=160324 RepID=A0A9N9VCP8_9HYPO|nr:unnamed protein product [Clonostachys rhizophaga]
MASTAQKLRIGVMMDTVQLSDVMGADILAGFRLETMKQAAAFAPELVGDVVQYAPDMELFYLSSTLDPTETTMGLKYVPNMTYDDCPRDLDIVLIGGPWPTHRPAAADKFMKEAWEKTPVWLTTCTGSLWLASSGVLKGYKATTNRSFIPTAQQLSPDVEWVTQRWVTGPKPYTGESSLKPALWTAGAAYCGIDMIVKFCYETFNTKLIDLVGEGMGFDADSKRGQDY